MYGPCMAHEQFLQSRCEAEHLAGSDKKYFFAYQPRFKGSFFLYTDKF